MNSSEQVRSSDHSCVLKAAHPAGVELISEYSTRTIKYQDHTRTIPGLSNIIINIIIINLFHLIQLVCTSTEGAKKCVKILHDTIVIIITILFPYNLN